MNLPELHEGLGSPYRVWTAAHLPSAQLPDFEPGHVAATFVNLGNGWLLDVEGGVVAAWRLGEPHELNGRRFADERAAWLALYGAGLAGVMVYEHDARRAGFPPLAS